MEVQEREVERLTEDKRRLVGELELAWRAAGDKDT